jgi:hypothetical protein
MAQHQPPVAQFEFGGVNTADNPTRRPRNSAVVCRDVRIMPGNWPRLRGGRVGRYNLSGVSGLVLDIKPFRSLSSAGSVDQLAHVVYGSSPKWNWFSLLSYIMSPTGIEDIATANDGSYCVSNAAASCNLNDRPLYYQGLGTRSGGVSKPPFSTYSGFVRYFGLDSYCPGSNPTAAFVGTIRSSPLEAFRYGLVSTIQQRRITATLCWPARSH